MGGGVIAIQANEYIEEIIPEYPGGIGGGGTVIPSSPSHNPPSPFFTFSNFFCIRSKVFAPIMYRGWVAVPVG